MIAVRNKSEIQAQMNGLAGQNGDEYADTVQSYFEHYGLDWPQARHHFGWFESGGLRLAGHLWNPPAAKATVIVLHGYLNHTGQMKHLIAGLLESGFAVGSFDLPGHGLSEGQSAAVGAFSDYTQALLDFVLTIRAVCPGPLHFVGFSTGAGVGIDYLVHARQTVFDRIILVAPLIRWRGYLASKATYASYRTFTDRVRRMPQKNSSDNNFLSFNRNDDYLHGRYVALDWVRALYDWNARLTAATPCDKEVFILQGDRDMTVDWRYNLGLLRGKFPAANVQMVKGARHELFNERTEIRASCLVAIMKYLSKLQIQSH
jgi:alpha-beta hydrolase superfamily lysophospholipase